VEYSIKLFDRHRAIIPNTVAEKDREIKKINMIIVRMDKRKDIAIVE